MPPKKKKPVINPAVVGTVSTRSTRRQSIVNIHIPKTKSKNTGKVSKNNPIILNTLSPNSLAKQIRTTYSRVLKNKSDVSSQNVNNKSDNESNKKLTSIIATTENIKFGKNEAVREILEDWSDDESQDTKRKTGELRYNGDSSSSSETERSKYFENLEFGADDINEIIGDNFRSIKSNACNITDVNEIELTLTSGEKEEMSENEKHVKENLMYSELKVSKERSEESVPVCSNNAEEIIEQNIVEFEDNLVLECVTEEIVSESGEHVLYTEELVSTEMSQNIDQDKMAPDNMESSNANIKTPIYSDNAKGIQESILLEDTSQSISTNDSNDAEVQSFFSKEIENNEIVNKEDIPNIETDHLSEEQVPLLDDKLQLAEVMTMFESSSMDIENLGEDTESSIDELEKTLASNISQNTMYDGSLSELRKTLENDYVEDSLSEKAFGYDQSETKIEKTDERKLDEETLGEKIAYLKLRDQSSADDIIQRVSELNLEIDETRDQPQHDKLGNRKLTKKLAPRRAKSAENRSPKTPKEKKTKPPKIIKIENSPKEKKSKETKKEFKPKKKLTATKLSKIMKDKQEKVEKKDMKSDVDIEDTEVRRSSRIKSISVLKKKTTGHGLVKSKSEPSLNESDICDNSSNQTESDRGTPLPSPKVTRVRKTRWSKSTDNLTDLSQLNMNSRIENISENRMDVDENPAKDPVIEARLKSFVHLKENMYKTDRMTCKEAKKMTCDCFLTAEEKDADEYGCGEDCLNRLLLIECGNLCQVGERCTNKRFQKGQFAPVEVFNTEKKGLGLRAAANIPYGEFILEYIGEVLNSDEFDKRAEVYSQDKNIHYYFMALRADAIIDATMKGNISRFINHSCDPNAETQKWTVNGELRIGFFSTRTILAGEEVTFDYRFQRYGKEAQKCYCEASTCRGWLGEQPDDSDDEEEEDEEEVIEEIKVKTPELPVKPAKEIPEVKVDIEIGIKEVPSIEEIIEVKPKIEIEEIKPEEIKEEPTVTDPATVPVIVRKRTPKKKKPRIELFEEIDQLNEEIEMLVTTGLKNQAHTLKLSRLMVRAKEPHQRTKLLRVLRRGELPCRRLFLDYHGLRLMHGYMIDVQHLVLSNKKYESLRLEVLQTLAVLPIPNKTMLQDSKVLPTVEKWATSKDLSSPLDSESSSPAPEQGPNDTQMDRMKEETHSLVELKKDDSMPEPSIEDKEEEIRFLAGKLIEKWSNLKEVFRIPKKERIEQMKEHEREANKKFMQSSYGNDHDKDRKSDRYRSISKHKSDRDKKVVKSGEKPSAEFIRLSKIERRKLFALQHELKEEERRLKQREMWRQHEMNCLMIGTDPRFTAPFDPNRGYQCIWNPQIGQWQNYPLPQNMPLFPGQTPALPNLSVPPPQIAKSVPTFPYSAPIAINTNLGMAIPHPGSMPQTSIGSISGIPGGMPQNIPGGMPGGMPQNIPANMKANMPPNLPIRDMPKNIPVGIPGGVPQNSPGIMPHNAQGPGIIPMNTPVIIPQNTPGIITQNTSRSMPHNIHCAIPGGITQNMGQNMLGNIPQNLHGNVPQNMHGNIPQNMHGNIPQNMHGNMPQNIPGGMPQNIPGGVQQNVSGGMSQNMPGSISGGIPLNIASGLTHNIPASIPGNIPHVSGSVQNIAGVSQNILSNIVQQQNIPLHLKGPPPTATSSMQYKETIVKEEDPCKVKFMGPIPPPAPLPPKWKCVKDKYGRPYYYHIKIRKSQWEPPPLLEPPPQEDQAEFSEETESSSDTSSLSSESSSENSDSEEDMDDTRLLLQVRKQMDKSRKPLLKLPLPEFIKTEDDVDSIPSPDDNYITEMDADTKQEKSIASTSFIEVEGGRPSIDIRLKEQFNLKEEAVPRKKRRIGLCEERLISPRSEEDKMQFKEDVKRYKANKEKLRRQKELIYQQTKNQLKDIELKKAKEKEKRPKVQLKVKIKDMPDFNSEAAKKIKETFRANMASTVVSSLNVYRKADCTEGKITNTEDFKHLARKLTHFVMLKEMKHIARIEDLTCTDNVKVKAREYIRKYMSKFGEVYVKRNDSPDFKD